jgi:hypothetical protein
MTYHKLNGLLIILDELKQVFILKFLGLNVK